MMDTDHKIFDHCYHVLCFQEQDGQFLRCLRAIPGFAAKRDAGQCSCGALAYRERIDQLVQFQIQHGDQFFHFILRDLAAVDVFFIIRIQVLVHASEADARTPALLHDRDIGDPDGLQCLIESLCRISRNFVADISDLFQFGFPLRISARLCLPGSFFGQMLRINDHG